MKIARNRPPRPAEGTRMTSPIDVSASLSAAARAASPVASPAAPSPAGAADRGTRTFAEVLAHAPARAETSAGPAPPEGRVAVAPPAPPAVAATSAARALERLASEVQRGEQRVEAMLAAARAGRTFGPAELLALQSETFRYAQTVEIVSRTADRLVGGLKQLLNTQV